MSRTRFDNEETMLYREAYALALPSKFMLVDISPDDTVAYLTLGSVLREDLLGANSQGQEFSLTDSYLHAISLHPTSGIRLDEDYAMIYTSIIMNSPYIHVPMDDPDAPARWAAQGLDVTQPIFVPDQRYVEEIRQLYPNAVIDILSQEDQASLLGEVNVFLENMTPEEGRYTPYLRFDDLYTSRETWMNGISRQLEADDLRIQRIDSIFTALERYTPIEKNELRLGTVVMETRPQVVLSYNPDGTKRLGSEVTEDLYINIFDSAVVNINVPSIQYNERLGAEVDRSKLRGSNLNRALRRSTESRTLTKMTTQGDQTEYVIPSSSAIGMLSMMVRHDNTDYTDTAVSKYSYARLDSSGRLTIRVPDVAKNPTSIDNMRTNIESVMPISIQTMREIRLTGSFRVYGIELNLTIFRHVLLTEDLFNNYIYIDESSREATGKDTYHYKSLINKYPQEGKSTNALSSISFTITPEILRQDTEDIISVPEGYADVTYPAGTRFLNITIIRGDSIDVVNQFMDIFPRLLRAYELSTTATDETNPITLFTTYLGYQYPPDLPELPTNVSYSSAPAPVIPRGRAARRTELGEALPNVFPPDYARRCAPNNRPKLIRPEEVNEWRQKSFTRFGITRTFQVLSFANNYFVCPNENAPYPRLFKNNMENALEYPMLPCCYASEETTQPSVVDPEGDEEEEEALLLPPNVVAVESTREQRVVTPLTLRNRTKLRMNMFTPENRVAALPVYIEQLMNFIGTRQSISPRSDVGICRLGVPRSPNSLIHCVLIALEDEEYFLITPPEREAYVRDIRNHMLTLEPGLFKQELYDQTDDEIRRQIANLDSFLDPSLFYRALEVLYPCSIFTFSESGVDKRTTEDHGALEIPRHKLFHTRRKIGNPVILLYKNMGTRQERRTYPQIELIVDVRGANPREERVIPSWDLAVEDSMLNILNLTQSVNTWRYQRGAAEGLGATDRPSTLLERVNISRNIGEGPDTPMEGAFSTGSGGLVRRINEYSGYRYYDELMLNGSEPISQFIDSFGKLRGLTFRLTPTGKILDDLRPLLGDEFTGSVLYTVSFKPMQPLNLPQGTEVVRTPHEILTKILGTPTSRSSTGLWFSLGADREAIFSPCSNVSELSNIPRGPSDPFFIYPGQKEELPRYRKLKRDSLILLQVVQWLFVVYMKNLANNRGVDYKDYLTVEMIDRFFTDAIFIASDRGIDTSQVYTFTSSSRGGIGNRLPDLANLREALNYLRRTGAIHSSSGKFVIMGSKLADGVRYYLKMFIRDNNNYDQIKTITGFYDDESVFQQRPNTVIFLSLESRDEYLRSLKNSNQRNEVITTSINDSKYDITEPYFYMDQNRRVSLIQNVGGNVVDDAIAIANTWIQREYNPGYNSGRRTIILPDTSVPDNVLQYRVDIGLKMIPQPKSGVTYTRSNPEILYYAGDHHAAILRL